MKMFFLICFFSSGVFANDLGFRYINGECVDNTGKKGLNPSFFGPCSDLRGTTLRRLDFTDLDFSGSQFSGADLQTTLFNNSNLTGASFVDANLSGVNFDDAQIVNANFSKARINNATFADAVIEKSQFTDVDFQNNDFSYIKFQDCDFKRANFTGVKLGQARFIHADLSDAKFNLAQMQKSVFVNSIIDRTDFSNAVMDSADFSMVKGTDTKWTGAQMLKVNLSKSILTKAQFNSAILTGANLSGADLTKAALKSTDLTDVVYQDTQFNGAVYSKKTKLPFSDEQAKILGLVRIRVSTVLILWSKMNEYTTNFATGLREQSGGEVEAVLATVPEKDFTNEIALSNYDAIIHLGGSSYEFTEMPATGQMALLNFVKNGGTFIYEEWMSYDVDNGRYKSMLDLVLFTRTSGDEGASTVTIADTQRNHPVVAGLNGVLNLSFVGINIGPVVSFTSDPVVVLATDQKGSPAIGVRKVGLGQSIAFNFTCTYSQSTCLNDPSVRTLYINSILSR